MWIDQEGVVLSKNRLEKQKKKRKAKKAKLPTQAHVYVPRERLNITHAANQGGPLNFFGPKKET